MFSADIDIEDTMQALIAYESGVVVNYLLTAYDAAEGYRVVFHGERGVLTLETIERAYVREDGGLVRPALPETSSVVVQPLFAKPYRLVIPEAEGSHGGGDRVMLEHLFRQGGDDPFGRTADERSGAAMVERFRWKIIAANVSSIASGERRSRSRLGRPRRRRHPAIPDTPAAPFGGGHTRVFDPSAYAFLAGAPALEDLHHR